MIAALRPDRVWWKYSDEPRTAFSSRVGYSWKILSRPVGREFWRLVNLENRRFALRGGIGGGFNHVHASSLAVEINNAVGEGEEGIILGPADVPAGMKGGATLPDDDPARQLGFFAIASWAWAGRG